MVRGQIRLVARSSIAGVVVSLEGGIVGDEPVVAVGEAEVGRADVVEAGDYGVHGADASVHHQQIPRARGARHT
ncbi:hypothetical protein NL676_028985 [Syzygium grande]|nr:hypothetical protein NL676_028985 [Syzygium grande]